MTKRKDKERIMAKIAFHGMELDEVTETKVFDEPHDMFVWNSSDSVPTRKSVCAIIPYRHAGSVITTNGAYEHCAEIPKKPEPRRATNRELARWLAQGNGEWCNCIGDSSRAAIEWWYDQGHSETKANNVFVRKWDDTEWHTPDVEYMSIEEDK